MWTLHRGRAETSNAPSYTQLAHIAAAYFAATLRNAVWALSMLISSSEDDKGSRSHNNEAGQGVIEGRKNRLTG